MLGADVVVPELERLPQRHLEHGLGPGREGDVPGRRLPAVTDDRLDVGPGPLERHAERLQCRRRDTLALVDEPQQDVLGPDVVVVEEAGLLLGEDDHWTCPVREPFEHSTPRCRRHLRAGSRAALSSRRRCPVSPERVGNAHGFVRSRLDADVGDGRGADDLAVDPRRVPEVEGGVAEPGGLDRDLDAVVEAGGALPLDDGLDEHDVELVEERDRRLVAERLEEARARLVEVGEPVGVEDDALGVDLRVPRTDGVHERLNECAPGRRSHAPAQSDRPEDHQDRAADEQLRGHDPQCDVSRWCRRR